MAISTCPYRTSTRKYERTCTIFEPCVVSFFYKINFNRVSNSWIQRKPDILSAWSGSNCLQRFSTDNTSRKRVKVSWDKTMSSGQGIWEVRVGWNKISLSRSPFVTRQALWCQTLILETIFLSHCHTSNGYFFCSRLIFKFKISFQKTTNMLSCSITW